MAKAAVHLPVVGLGSTLRKDAWWAGPLATGTVLLSFIAYATFRAFENKYFQHGPYLSPFYSPYVPTAGWPIPFLTPAMVILPIPASFRLTCYYYRKAYYRAFAMDPPACAVGERAPHKYNGETKLFLFQNLHRYALYLALLVLVVLWHDVWDALWFAGADGQKHFGVGVGTLVLTLNTTLLSLYTFSCHSLRHLIGGRVNSYSTTPLGKLRHTLWRGVTRLNLGHSTWAWCSLFGVALTDVYVRFAAAGALNDRIF